MIITPSIKGFATKAAKTEGTVRAGHVHSIRRAFERQMPREQAKHATRRLIRAA